MSAGFSAAPEFVAARRALLDVLEVLAPQSDALVLVGAQAVYLHAPLGDPRPMYTTDADFAIDPDILISSHDMAASLLAAGFVPGPSGNPGSWLSTSGIVIDLMVPTLHAPGARRAAPLPGQGPRTARTASGLEVALYDHAFTTIPSLDALDQRSTTVKTAGPAALVVAKSVKIRERLSGQRPDRLIPKDAGDLLRLLRNGSSWRIGNRLAELSAIELVRPQIQEVVEWLEAQASRGRGGLIDLAVVDRTGIESETQVAESFRTLIDELETGYRE